MANQIIISNLLQVAIFFSRICFSTAFVSTAITHCSLRSLEILLPFSEDNMSFPVRKNTVLSENNFDSEEGGPNKSGIEEELERLQEQLALTEALEERNKAQLDSFVDEKDQWNSMDEDEQFLLKSKNAIIKKMELLTEQMILLWMGRKSMDG
jgi:hypothetical protein